jgi:hypothetical protein
LTVTGLSQKMRARTVLPVSSQQGNDDYAEIVVPGFGSATIEAVASDAPVTNGEPVHVKVDAQMLPYTTQTGTIVSLTGKPAEVLNSNARVQAYIKGLTSGRGAVYQFDEAALLAGTAPTSLVQIPLDGSTYHAVTDVHGRVVYVQPNNEFGNALDEAYATITYRVNDECWHSADGTIPIYVKYDNNEAPTTEHTAVNTNENQAVVLTFVGVDSRDHELKVDVTSLPTNPAGNPDLAGKLYQYSDACWNAVNANFRAVSGCVEVTSANSKLSGTVNQNGPESTWITTVRAIYVPHEYANSQGIPEVYASKPTLTYKFVQVANAQDLSGGFAQLSTSPVSFDIVIAAVNQAPTAKLNYAVSSTWLSFPAAGSANVDPAACATVEGEPIDGKCIYDQNLGVPYPDSPAPESIFLSGVDVDNDELSLVVQSISCPAGATIESIKTGQRLAPGSVINDEFVGGIWSPQVRFMPTQDGSGNPYCTFTYKAFDGQLYSEDTATVIVAVNFKPLEPRSQNYRFFAPRKVETPVEFTAYSVNDKVGDSVTAVYIRAIKISQCSGDTTSTLKIAGTTVNCAALPQTIVVANNDADVDVASGKQHTFSGSWLPTSASVNGFSIVATYIDSHQPALESLPYTLSFAFRLVNQAPELRFVTGSEGEADWGTGLVNRINIRLSQNSGSDSIGHDLRDVDSGEGDVTVTVKVIRRAEDSSALIEFDWNNPTIVSQVDSNTYTINGPVAAVHSVVSTIALSVSGTSKIQFNISITANDNGYSGACTADDVNPCSKTATALLIITADSAANVVAIGLAAGAGGAALAAAAAAAIAWRALREPPTESYNPWEMDDAVEGTVMNPLFEASGNSGDNPMFEGASKN